MRRKFPPSSEKPTSSPFVPGDLVLVKHTDQQGTVTRIPSQYYSEVHVDGRRLMLPNEWLVECNSKEQEL